MKTAKDSTELYSSLDKYYKSISEKNNLYKDHSKQLGDLIGKLDFDGIWEFINNHVLDNTLENERDTVLIPDMHEWDGIKKLLMKKRLSKTDYRTFSNISASMPKKVTDLAIENCFDSEVLEKKILLPKKEYLSKVYDSVLGTDKWLIG